MLWILVQHAAMAGDGGWAASPFGVGLFVHERPVRGAVYALTQVVGIGGVVFGGVDMVEAQELEDEDRLSRDQAMTAAGIGLAALSFAASLIDGSKVHELDCVQAEAQLRGLDAWDDALARREMAARGFAP